MYKWTALFGMLFLLACAEAAEPSPWDAWRLGYTNFELGKQVRNRGDYTAALEAFEKSRSYYTMVRRTRPDWNQKVIRERISACDAQITELRRLLGYRESGSSGVPARRGGEAPSNAGPDKAISTSTQLLVLRSKIADMQAELDELRRERQTRRHTEEELSKLTWDLRRSQEKYALLEKSHRKLQEEAKRPDTALNELRKQLVLKHDELENSEKTRRLLEERIRRGEQSMLDLNREKNLLRNQLRQELEERHRLERESVALRESGDAERARLARATARIAELERSLGEMENAPRKRSADAGARDDASAEELLRLRSIVEAAGKRADQFQRQCVALRAENEQLLKNLHRSEQARSRSEQEALNMRGEASKQQARAESLTAELGSVRELRLHHEQELKRLMGELDALKIRLSSRDSEDFKALMDARSLQQKLESDMDALKSREAELNTRLAEARDEAEKLRRANETTVGALQQARKELAVLGPEAEKFRELYPRYQEMERNFQALRKENQENRVKLAAADPREAELQRIKLRLAELDRLKGALGREQRLNAELAAAKRQQENELEELRGRGAELSAARKQLEGLKALRREVQELRRVNQEAVSRLEAMRKLENELVTVKKALIESGAAQLELHEVKNAYAKVLGERNAAAAEAARLRDELASRSGGRSEEATGRGAAQELERVRQELRSVRDRNEKLEALLPQLEQLKKLNGELIHAQSFESELVKARAELCELGRYKDELSGVIKLNEQLTMEKAELEKELARRPRLPQSEQMAETLKLSMISRGKKPEDYVADGMLAESGGNNELAVWNYRKALESAPRHVEASERLGKLLLSRRRYDEAAKSLAVARAAHPDRLDLALAISRAYLGGKRHGNALAVLEPLLKLHPENGEVLTAAALAEAENGDNAKAEALLKLAIRYLPDAAEPKLELARLLVRSDSARMEDAARLYEEAKLSGAPPDLELEPLLGPRLDRRRELESFLSSALSEAFENRDYSGAAWYCGQLSELKLRTGYYTVLLALAQYLGGELGAARETLTFNTESAHGMLVSALIELKNGDRKAFSAALRRAVELNGGKPAVIDAQWRNLGFALDAAAAGEPAAAAELRRAYRWEAAR